MLPITYSLASLKKQRVELRNSIIQASLTSCEFVILRLGMHLCPDNSQLRVFTFAAYN
jgi:hypothetical protein